MAGGGRWRGDGRGERRERMRLRVRRRVYEILEVAAPGHRWSRAFEIFIVSLIVLNVAAMVLERVPAKRRRGKRDW